MYGFFAGNKLQSVNHKPIKKGILFLYCNFWFCYSSVKRQGKETVDTASVKVAWNLRLFVAKRLQVFPAMMTRFVTDIKPAFVIIQSTSGIFNRTFWLHKWWLECLSVSALCNNSLQAAEIFPRLPTWQRYFPLERNYATLPLLSNERIRLHIFVSILSYPFLSAPVSSYALPSHSDCCVYGSLQIPRGQDILLVCWHMQLTNTYVPPHVDACAHTNLGRQSTYLPCISAFSFLMYTGWMICLFFSSLRHSMVSTKCVIM